MVNENDIYFVLNRTKLTIKSLILLLEEERDFNLLIYSIASSLSEQDLLDLDDISIKLKLKLIFYYFSHIQNMDFDEGVLLSDIVLNNYDYFFKQCREIDKEQGSVIISCCKLLDSESISKDAEDDVCIFFAKSQTPKLHNNIPHWQKIIKKTKLLISGVNISEIK